MICSKCKKESPEGSIFCQFCGEKYSEGNDKTENDLVTAKWDGLSNRKETRLRYCKHCGSAIERKTSQCPQCGKRTTIITSFFFMSILIIILLTLSCVQLVGEINRNHERTIVIVEKEKELTEVKKLLDEKTQIITSLELEIKSLKIDLDIRKTINNK